MDKPKVTDSLIMAQALMRAILLNSDSKTNADHTDCGAWLWEDGYTIDVDKLRGYHDKQSQIAIRNKGKKSPITFEKYSRDRMLKESQRNK